MASRRTSGVKSDESAIDAAKAGVAQTTEIATTGTTGNGQALAGELMPSSSQVGSVDQLVAAVSEHLGGSGIPSFDNFEGTPIERMQFVTLANSNVTKPMADCVDEVIELKHWSIKPIMYESGNGQVEPTVRVVLFDSKGDAYHATSTGIFDSLKMILQTVGTGELPDGLKFKINQTTTGRGRKLLQLVPVIDRK